jgi:hypothetical protein
MPGLAERALRITRERYADFFPTLACEKHTEIHDLYLADDTGWFMVPHKLRPRVYISR